jgi:hypothetical protein
MFTACTAYTAALYSMVSMVVIARSYGGDRTLGLALNVAKV